MRFQKSDSGFTLTDLLAIVIISLILVSMFLGSYNGKSTAKEQIKLCQDNGGSAMTRSSNGVEYFYSCIYPPKQK